MNDVLEYPSRNQDEIDRSAGIRQQSFSFYMEENLMTYQQKPKLAHLPLREQPAYRVKTDPEACTLVELLASVVGGQRQIEIAEALVAKFGGLRGLVNATPYELTSSVSGVGESTAVRLKASLGLAQRYLTPGERQPQIHCPEDLMDLVGATLSHKEQEHLLVVLLDTRNRVLDVIKVYHGNLNGSMVRIAEIFRPAIRRNAAAIAIAHNHPSGTASPSPPDIKLTREIIKTGKLIGVDVLDHLVVGQGRFVSLKRAGLGFPSDSS
jgi:DNA repair protein RadC